MLSVVAGSTTYCVYTQFQPLSLFAKAEKWKEEELCVPLVRMPRTCSVQGHAWQVTQCCEEQGYWMCLCICTSETAALH